MLQNPRKTFGFKKNMVYKIPPGGGKPYPASGLCIMINIAFSAALLTLHKYLPFKWHFIAKQYKTICHHATLFAQLN